MAEPRHRLPFGARLKDSMDALPFIMAFGLIVLLGIALSSRLVGAASELTGGAAVPMAVLGWSTLGFLPAAHRFAVTGRPRATASSRHGVPGPTVRRLVPFGLAVAVAVPFLPVGGRVFVGHMVGWSHLPGGDAFTAGWVAGLVTLLLYMAVTAFSAGGRFAALVPLAGLAVAVAAVTFW